MIDKILEKAVKIVKVSTVTRLIGDDNELADVEIRVVVNSQVENNREIIIMVSDPIKVFFRVLVKKTDTVNPSFYVEVFTLYDFGSVITS